MSQSLSTIGEIMGEFIVRQNSATTVSYYTDAVVKGWVDQAHKYAAGYKKWPMTEGRISTAYSSLATDDDGKVYGNYPEGWRLRSIRMLKVASRIFGKKEFYAFNKFLQNYPDADDEIFSDYGNLYYLNSNAGSGTVTVWGQFIPLLDTTDLSAPTIFTGVDEDGNQAIVEIMQSFAYTREKKEDEAAAHLLKGQGLLEGVWKKFTDEGAGYQQPDGDEGMFKRIDVVGGDFRENLLKRDQF